MCCLGIFYHYIFALIYSDFIKLKTYELSTFPKVIECDEPYLEFNCRFLGFHTLELFELVKKHDYWHGPFLDCPFLVTVNIKG